MPITERHHPPQRRQPPFSPLPEGKARFWVISATLLSLFVGALDTLIMSAAMPTIVSELGGLHLYSWVFSAYLLSRSVSLPVFGKLSDLYPNRRLFVLTNLIFLIGSVLAGFSENMMMLTLARVIQGIGAGGNFALTYIVLADISAPAERGRMMSLASFVWGLASVLGPTFGGYMVSCASWRWIFFINLPIGLLSILGILRFLVETREKRKHAVIDYAGILTFSAAVLSLLTACMLAGGDYPWFSAPVLTLLLATLVFTRMFYRIEQKASDPLLSMDFFRARGFSVGNAAAFLASFVIFSVLAFIPLFIQGAMGETPARLGTAMASLSLGWSAGALGCGRAAHRYGERSLSIRGCLLLLTGTVMTLFFTEQTSLTVCSLVLAFTGVGMGLISISTLLIVQNSIDSHHLGVATSSHQFSRTLGGTVGVGVCGSIVTSGFSEAVSGLSRTGAASGIPPELHDMLKNNYENLFRPEIQARLDPEAGQMLFSVIGMRVLDVFTILAAVAGICLLLALRLPKRDGAG